MTKPVSADAAARTIVGDHGTLEDLEALKRRASRSPT